MIALDFRFIWRKKATGTVTRQLSHPVPPRTIALARQAAMDLAAADCVASDEILQVEGRSGGEGEPWVTLYDVIPGRRA
jgi:hypothetical protein